MLANRNPGPGLGFKRTYKPFYSNRLDDRLPERSPVQSSLLASRTLRVHESGNGFRTSTDRLHLKPALAQAQAGEEWATGIDSPIERRAEGATADTGDSGTSPNLPAQASLAWRSESSQT